MPGESFGGLSKIALRSSVRDDDGVDQLNHFVTVTLFTLFGAITGFKEHAMQPINCWNDDLFAKKYFAPYHAHVSLYCWSRSMYPYPNKSDHDIVPYKLTSEGAMDPSTLDKKDLKEISFYRWVTVLFFLQAVLFKVPNILWRELNSYTGSNIIKMIEMLQSVLFASDSMKKELLQKVALFLEQWLRLHRKPRWFEKAESELRRACRCCTVTVEPAWYGDLLGHNIITDGAAKMVKVTVSKTQGTLSCCMMCVGNNMDNYLSTAYLLVKALYVTNIVIQFLLLSAFLQLNFWTFGPTQLGVYYTAPAEHHKLLFMDAIDTFPAVALCHFQVLHEGQPEGKWVQCHLEINLFLENLFLIEWTWLLILLIVTCVNTCVWIFRLLQTQTAIRFVQGYLKLMELCKSPQPFPAGCTLQLFVTQYLRNDGVFILRILAVNTNEVLMAQLVEELWLRYINMFKAELEQDK